MRFAANGPNFPDELLIARDEGRVVFFCGAGVSQAKAGLRDFIDLARDVANKLSIPPDNPARQLISAIETFQPIPGVGSLVAADRVFGLIERDYQSRDIYRAIAASLKPDGAPDLTAHRALLDLATGPDGIIRLITTNFDLLFEDCDPKIPVSRQPRLPDPLRSQDFRGIIHLHGHVTADYTDAAGDGLIISSGEFGRAYLSDRWAADFIKTVLERFFVVFVGYSADDPPMQYLLEALNRSPGSFSGAYALQSGSYEDAEARWVQKGVKPIVYEADQHSLLWGSMDLWAEEHDARLNGTRLC
jgi:SIR2-like domain